jgi:hypothetical protein
LDRHPVRLVHPIAREKWIIRISANDEELLSRRKSPRHGRLEHLFRELVRIPRLAKHPNFSLEVLIIREEEVRRDDGKGSWRRNGQSIADRRLLSILDRHIFISNKDYLDLLPEETRQCSSVRSRQLRMAYLEIKSLETTICMTSTLNIYPFMRSTNSCAMITA